MTTIPNLDPNIFSSFGDEWQRFNLQGMGHEEAAIVFGDYFTTFPWH